MGVSIEKSVFAGNGRYGAIINDDTVGAFNIDLGGGTLGSAGNNSIYSNGTAGAAYRDMLLDLDGGEVSAQGNWWGRIGGPDMTPGSERIINDVGACPANCGTADSRTRWITILISNPVRRRAAPPLFLDSAPSL